jgi:serine/threonine-protein kinase ULK/ATG1
MAPEILEEKPYDNKCDLWSLGVIIYQLCFKQYPYSGNTSYDLMKQINQLKQNHFKKTNDENLNALIRDLLKPNPEERLTWDQYFNHPFFK